MNTLKPDLKKYVSIYILCFVFLSCKTYSVQSISSNLDNEDQNVSLEYQLPDAENLEDLIVVSSEISSKSDISYLEEGILIIPSSLHRDKPKLSKPITINYNLESDLLLLDVKKHKVPKKVIITKKSPVTPVKIVAKAKNNITPRKGVVKVEVKSPKPLINKIKTDKVTESVKRKTIVLDKMDVLVGKIFTVEMDQSGWLFEKQVDGVLFEDKYYTSDKVLFNFVATETGRYTIEFIRYDHDGSLYSTAEINSLETKINEQVTVKSDSQVIIIPEATIKSVNKKTQLEEDLLNIDLVDNPDEIYFNLANIYYDEGLLKKAKELYEFVYDNYPLSIYYEEAEEKMNYIISNFLKVR